MERQYNAPQFNLRDQRSVQGGQVAADPDARVRAPLSVGDDSWMDRMLGGMLQNASGFAEKAADKAFQAEYLEGAAAAGVVQSEEELESNPLTRDWKVAGYRDTMGKMALADMEGQFQADIPTLKEKSPEDLKTYLAERRAKLMPGMAGMSREARVSMAGQMLLQDRAATKTWTTEHTKFIIDQKGQAVNSQFSVSLNTLKAANQQFAIGDITQEDYQSVLQTTAGAAFGSVWMDETLPVAVKQKLTGELVSRALADDNVALYDYLSANVMPDAGGKSGTLIQRLDGETQLRLANQYREARQRTADQRNMGVLEQFSTIGAQVDAGTYTGGYNDLKSVLNPMLLNNSINGSQYGSMLNKYLDKQYKNEVNSVLAEAVLKGDINAILGRDKSIEDGMNALESVQARRGLTPGQRMNQFLQVGLGGIDQGFKKAGEMLGVSLRQMVTSKGEILPQHMETFRTVNDALRSAEAQGMSNTRTRLLSGLGEDDRMFAEQIFRRVDTGASLEESVERAKEQQVKDSTLSPAIRAARAQGTAQTLSKSIDSLEPRGLISSVWTWTKANVFGSKDAQSDLALRPVSNVGDRDHWFGDSPTVQFYAEKSRAEIRMEADNVMLLRPSASPDEVLSVAKANVASRTISTEQGPLIMPRNVNLQTTFGVGAGNQAAIGQAIDGILQTHKAGSRWQLSFDQGRMFAQEFDKEGARIGNGMFMDSSSIRNRIEEDTQKRVKDAQSVFGSGHSVSGDGVRLTYNGDNTAGVPGTWMFNYRSNLIDHEGVRSTPYDDLSGNKDKAGNRIRTVGVGVSSHNEFYPPVGENGKVKSADVEKSFLGASNAAAVAGASTARDLGRNSEAGFSLMAELAYQSGTGFLTQDNKTGERYRTFADAFKGKDTKAAQEAFKGTAAWFYSRDPAKPERESKRQRSYLRLIEQAMKG